MVNFVTASGPGTEVRPRAEEARAVHAACKGRETALEEVVVHSANGTEVEGDVQDKETDEEVTKRLLVE